MTTKKERGEEEEEAKAKSPIREARQNFEPALHIWRGGREGGREGEAHAVVIDLRRKKEKKKVFVFSHKFFLVLTRLFLAIFSAILRATDSREMKEKIINYTRRRKRREEKESTPHAFPNLTPAEKKKEKLRAPPAGLLILQILPLPPSRPSPNPL